MDPAQSLQVPVLIASIAYSVIGIAIMMIGYKVFDLINRLNFTEELGKNNIAVGTMIAGFFIGISIIVAAAIHG